MKSIRALFLFALMLALLASCQQAGKQEIQEKEVKTSDTEGLETDNDDPEVSIKAKEIESYPISLYDQVEFDIDGDGEPENIEMYVNAEQDGEGKYLWDDGQDWLLVVKDGDKTYPLFEGWVQIGKLSFWLIESGETPMLILLKTGTAEFTLQTFTFEEKTQGFIQRTHFNPENVNFWYGTK
ncbi:hypothetical protein ACFYKX_03220 [Cytobacillus sp. FJAT-54145]|uniref:Lipoprotein n=1 Tax=Cytobacillus spartinae TaxID=3299023 RepID=A0ABW6K623_9BACI